jgi:hypothetical protein
MRMMKKLFQQGRSERRPEAYNSSPTHRLSEQTLAQAVR